MAKVQTVGFKSVVVTIPTPARAVPIKAEQVWTTEFEIHNPTGNQVIYYGNDDVASTTHIARAAGTTVSNVVLDLAGEPAHFDLNLIYVLGSAGESVRVQYRIKNPIAKG